MTILESVEQQKNFLLNLKNLYEGKKEGDPLDVLRSRAWDSFQKMGLPSRKTEVFQYVPLDLLYKKSFEITPASSLTYEEIKVFILPESQESVAVFVNGNLDLSLSNFKGLSKKVVAVSLQEALRSFGSYINNQVLKSLQNEKDPFAALNGACFQKALFLYVPPETTLESPLQILHVIDEKSEWNCPRIECFFGAFSHAKIAMTTACFGKNPHILNQAAQFSLEEGAEVSLSRTSFDLPEKAWHLGAIRANLKKSAKFTAVTIEDGAEGYRDDYRVSLIGENADVHLNGVCMLDGKKESHVHVLIDHQAPDCKSLQLFKRAVNGFSKSSFEGKIYVHPIAQKTQAFQLNNNLILNEGAMCYSKPNLEIFADDVQASHGATFGSLEEEKLFYLHTRGISKAVAKNLLVQGFCLEVIEKLDNASLLAMAAKKANYYG